MSREREAKAIEWRKDFENLRSPFPPEDPWRILKEDLKILGQYQQKPLKFHVNSSSEIKTILESPNGEFKKIEKFYSICWGMLSNLQSGGFGAQTSYRLVDFICIGLKYLIDQYLGINKIEINFDTNPKLSLPLPGYEFLTIDEGGVRYHAFYLESSVGYHGRHQEPRCYKIRNVPGIKLRDIVEIINKQLDNIPYKFFVDSIIPFFLQVSNTIITYNSKKDIDPEIKEKIDYLSRFLIGLKQPFLKAQQRIVEEETKRTILRAGPELPLSSAITKVIYEYLGTSSCHLSFFTESIHPQEEKLPGEIGLHTLGS